MVVHGIDRCRPDGGLCRQRGREVRQVQRGWRHAQRGPRNDVDYTDPALDYLSTGWEIEYSTCLKLMNYPDANGAKGSQLVPEAASGFPKVSNSGKTYDFTVKVPASRSSRTARP